MSNPPLVVDVAVSDSPSDILLLSKVRQTPFTAFASVKTFPEYTWMIFILFCSFVLLALIYKWLIMGLIDPNSVVIRE